MHYVYIIKSVNNDCSYVGYTTDIDQRLKEHNKGDSLHTAKYKPWVLQVYVAFSEKVAALEFEKYLKSHAGRVFANKRFF